MTAQTVWNYNKHLTRVCAVDLVSTGPYCLNHAKNPTQPPRDSGQWENRSQFGTVEGMHFNLPLLHLLLLLEMHNSFSTSFTSLAFLSSRPLALSLALSSLSEAKAVGPQVGLVLTVQTVPALSCWICLSVELYCVGVCMLTLDSQQESPVILFCSY